MNCSSQEVASGFSISGFKSDAKARKQRFKKQSTSTAAHFILDTTRAGLGTVTVARESEAGEDQPNP